MITAVVLSKNEEKNIERCIKSLLWCDEILLIDDYSTDKTVKIAKRFGAKIYKRHSNNDFAAQRNYALKKVSDSKLNQKKWVLFVDADEVVSKELAVEIKNTTDNTNNKGFYLKRKDFFLGKEIKHGEIGSIKLLRLACLRLGNIWKRKVHEYWKVKGEKEELKNPLIHFPHITLHEFIDDINNYSTIHAEELKKEKKTSNIFKIILWPAGKFIYYFIIKSGFLDGTEGFIVACMMSFHSFLAWSKLWIS